MGVGQFIPISEPVPIPISIFSVPIPYPFLFQFFIPISIINGVSSRRVVWVRIQLPSQKLWFLPPRWRGFHIYCVPSYFVSYFSLISNCIQLNIVSKFGIRALQYLIGFSWLLSWNLMEKLIFAYIIGVCKVNST